MKAKLLISAVLISLSFSFADAQEVTFLNKESFKANVWDYDANTSWKFKGNKPMIIDFYADWCKPCKMIAPHLKAIQSEYGNKLHAYIGIRIYLICTWNGYGSIDKWSWRYSYSNYNKCCLLLVD